MRAIRAFLIFMKALPMLASLLFAPVCVADAGAAPPVRIGVLAFKGSKEMTQDWDHLASWLESRIPERRFILLPFDQNALTAAVQSRAIDFILTNSGHYIALEHGEGANRIATLESPQALSPSQSIGSAIIVRKEAQIRTLSDLAGKRVEAVAADAFGGYLIAARELLRAGIDPQRDFAQLRFIGFPIQDIVQDVRNGRADAGIVRTCLLEDLILQGEVGPAELRVLAPIATPGFRCATSSRLYPDWPIAALPHTPPALSKQVALALLSMPRTADGYGWSVPSDYQSVDQLFSELKIGPYEGMREWTLERMARRYWGWLLFACCLLAAWIAHTIRVRYLINQRTRELHDAQTEHLRMEAEARQRQATLDHTARLAILGEMASAIAHELNQPLAAIRNFAHGMTRRINGGRMEPAPLLSAADEIALQSERAAGIIRDIRSFASKRVSEQRDFDLLTALGEAIAMFTAAHPQARLVWRSAAPDEGTPVLGNPLQIQQVMLNLLKNALDAQQAAGRAHAPIALSLERDERGWRVEVRDCGCGLQPGQFERLFEPFFTTKPDGFGLGLSLSKSIIENMGGTLSASPNIDQPGLSVFFRLPPQATDQAIEPAKAEGKT